MDDAAMAAARERQAEDLGLATRPAEPEPQVVHCIGIGLVLVLVMLVMEMRSLVLGITTVSHKLQFIILILTG